MLKEKSQNIRKRCFHRTVGAGNTLIEYSVVGVLVVVVSIGVMIALGGNFNTLMSELKDDMSKKAKSAGNQAAIAQQFQTHSSPMSITQSDGAVTRLEVPITSPTSGPTAQTVGTNGTDILAGDIRQFAEKFYASGDIDAQDYDLIMKVANKGHEIAAIQGMLEMARRNSKGDVTTYSNFRFTLNGQTFSPEQLTGALSTSISDFTSLKHQAQSREHVKRAPELLLVLEGSGGQIIISGGDTVDKTRSADVAAYVGEREVNDTNLTPGSQITNDHSGHICVAGKYKDTGIACTQ